MKFEEAFRKIMNEGFEIEQNVAYDYLYEIDGKLVTESEVIEFAENL